MASYLFNISASVGIYTETKRHEIKDFFLNKTYIYKTLNYLLTSTYKSNDICSLL